MCHYIPKPGHPERYDVQIASKFVSLRVLEKISQCKFQERDSLLSYLQGIPKAAAYRGHLFEMKAHELLVRGATIDTDCIPPDQSFKKTFKCEASREFCFFDSKDLSRALLETGPYHIPRATNFESIDSFYYPLGGDNKCSKTLLLFQMTVAPKNPINGKGLVEILRSLELLEIALAQPESVALIFVRPGDSATDVTGKRIISWAPVDNSESVAIIPNIGDNKMESLVNMGINTIGELRKNISEKKDPRDEETASDLEKFDKR